MSYDKEYNRVHKGLAQYVQLDTTEDEKALQSLSKEFSMRTFKEGELLWDLSTHSGQLHFILSGAFSEYIMHGSTPHLLRFYAKNRFAYSEDLILYSASSASYATCLVEARVASITAVTLDEYLTKEKLGGKLLTSLIELSMTEYRNTTYEMLQTNGIHRIHAAIEQFPDVLNLIPRKELADYLGISRASLFRSLRRIDNG